VEPIQINIIKEDLKDQLNFFIRRVFLLQCRRLKNFLYFAITVTLTISALFIFTNNETFIPLKAVLFGMTILLWVALLLFAPIIFIRRYKSTRSRDKYINSRRQNELSFSITFDDEKFSYITNYGTQDILWEKYKYYHEHNDSIYILSIKEPIVSLYFSKAEMGEGNYYLLLQLAKSKFDRLPPPF
jgi:hypothetical protein